MHPEWFRSTFLRVAKFLQIKEVGHNFLGEPILQNVLIIWCPLLYLNFKRFLDTNFLSFIRCQCILQDSGVLLSEIWIFDKLTTGDPISKGEPILENVSIIWSLLLYFNLKCFWTQFLRPSLNFNACARFRSTFLTVVKFLQIKEGGGGGGEGSYFLG